MSSENSERQPLQSITNTDASPYTYSYEQLIQHGEKLRKRKREQAEIDNNSDSTSSTAANATTASSQDEQASANDRNVRPKLDNQDHNPAQPPSFPAMPKEMPKELQAMLMGWYQSQQQGSTSTQEESEEVFHDHFPEDDSPVCSSRVTRRQPVSTLARSGVTKPAGRRSEDRFGRRPMPSRNRGGASTVSTRASLARMRGNTRGTVTVSTAPGGRRPGLTSRSISNAPVRGVPGIRAQLDEAQKQIETLQTELAQERSSNETLRNTIEEANKKNDGFESMVAALKDILSKRDEEIVEREKREKEMKIRLETVEELQQETEKKLRKATIESESQSSLNSTLQQETITLNVKLRSLESRLEREESEHKMELSTIKANLERELMTQKTMYEVQLEDLKQKHADEVRKLNDEMSGSLQSVKEESNSEIQTLRRQYDTLKIDLGYSEKTRTQLRECLEKLEEQLQDMTQKNKALEERRLKDEMYRRKLHNAIQELKGNIRVYCRVRPLLPKELPSDVAATPESASKAITHINYTDDHDERGIDILGETTTSALGVESVKKHSFQFDRVFKPIAKQDDVFGEISQLVQSALDGYKVCIFAYGQTGSGKTFTMEGKGITKGDSDCEQRGMIPRSVEQIFATAREMREQGWEYTIEGSFLEIYNETLRDLLVSDAQIARAQTAQQDQGNQSSKSSSNNNLPALNLDIKHDPTNGTFVQGLTYVTVTRPDQIYDLLRIASRNRKVAATECNERSSRSHSVFTLKITGRNDATDQVSNGVLNLIDLAGSERLNNSKVTGERMRETKFINSSLSCLGDVIHALAQKSKHVPFRNSKLTYLLQNCLGGDSKTLMFVNISPQQQNVNETICSLRFASKVNACEIGTARRKIDTATLSLLNQSSSSNK